MRSVDAAKSALLNLIKAKDKDVHLAVIKEKWIFFI